jgi:hypothetical protein
MLVRGSGIYYVLHLLLVICNAICFCMLYNIIGQVSNLLKWAIAAHGMNESSWGCKI